MSPNPEQKTKLFTQAVKLDDHFSQPNFQLGRMQFQKKDYKGAGAWLARVTRNDSHYMEANFLLGICRYYEGDFDGAIQQFRMVAAEVPLNEVYNDLGAALSRKDDNAALENFGKALEGDEGDPDYCSTQAMRFGSNASSSRRPNTFAPCWIVRGTIRMRQPCWAAASKWKVRAPAIPGARARTHQNDV